MSRRISPRKTPDVPCDGCGFLTAECECPPGPAFDTREEKPDAFPPEERDHGDDEKRAHDAS